MQSDDVDIPSSIKGESNTKHFLRI